MLQRAKPPRFSLLSPAPTPFCNSNCSWKFSHISHSAFCSVFRVFFPNAPFACYFAACLPLSLLPSLRFIALQLPQFVSALVSLQTRRVAATATRCHFAILSTCNTAAEAAAAKNFSALFYAEVCRPFYCSTPFLSPLFTLLCHCLMNE